VRNTTASAERIGRYRRGHLSEWLAAAALLAKGYRILGRRVRTPYGEIDLVALRGRRLAFVEVKRRATRGEAEAAITPGRPHRPLGRVLGQPPPSLSRP
jgi:putative endonuclease